MSKKTFIIIIVLVLIFDVSFYTYWKMTHAPVELVPVDSEYGLAPMTKESQSTVDVTGYLYMSADLGDDTIPTNVFAYNLADDEITQVTFDSLHYDFDIVDSVHGLVMMSKEKDGADAFRPAWIDFSTNEYGLFNTVSSWNETGLVASPDGIHIAYMSQWNELGDEIDDLFSLEKWNVTIVDPVTVDVVTLESAGRPQWVHEGADLLYVKEDGIYRYNMKEGVSVRVYDAYKNLSFNSDLAVASNDSYAVFTDRSTGMISVIVVTDLDTRDVSEVGRVVNNQARYSDPVIDPRNQFYAVRTEEDGKSIIEIRAFESRTILKKIVIEDFPADRVTLDAWGSHLMTDISTIDSKDAHN